MPHPGRLLHPGLSPLQADLLSLLGWLVHISGAWSSQAQPAAHLLDTDADRRLCATGGARRSNGACTATWGRLGARLAALRGPPKAVKPLPLGTLKLTLRAVEIVDEEADVPAFFVLLKCGRTGAGRRASRRPSVATGRPGTGRCGSWAPGPSGQGAFPD